MQLLCLATISHDPRVTARQIAQIPFSSGAETANGEIGESQPSISGLKRVDFGVLRQLGHSSEVFRQPTRRGT